MQLKYIPTQEIDNIKIRLYNHFYKNNEDIFKRDKISYWHNANKFVEKALQDWMYYSINPFKEKYEEQDKENKKKDDKDNKGKPGTLEKITRKFYFKKDKK